MHDCDMTQELEPLQENSEAAGADAHSDNEYVEEGRLQGCESTNHSADSCYGDLWECASCSKTVCWAEGTDNDPDICDTCWVEKHSSSGSPKVEQGWHR